MKDNIRLERAAGGIVVRVQAGRKEVLLIDDAYGHVAFPKGHVEMGETWQAAAIREVAEETGIVAQMVAPIGRVEYFIERDGVQIRKQVRLFLMQAKTNGAPKHQVEEVRRAYFLPWPQAIQQLAKQGYSNWSWALESADVLWRWHEGDWEKVWRQAVQNLSDTEIDDLWRQVAELNAELVQVADNELQAVAGSWYQKANLDRGGVATTRVPCDFPEEPAVATAVLRQAVESMLLQPEVSVIEVENLCDQSMGQQFRSVCVNPMYAGTVATRLQKSQVIPCIALGFPFGANSPNALAAEAKHGLADGARELDVVIPVGAMVEDDIWTVYEHIQAVCSVAKAKAVDVVVKVILECHFLSPLQVAKASLVSIAAGADFIITSTDFAPGGALVADVALMALAAGNRASVMAAGGIHSRTQARLFLRYGATCLGTQSGMSVIRE
ncbi:deoxyribose-phosphate aldolase [Alicyclobacillaceae bacterium I2511]|nr:deoxyribose-phosphate aldolase [Alicyclobacillaceae bacterium I2511]